MEKLEMDEMTDSSNQSSQKFINEEALFNCLVIAFKNLNSMKDRENLAEFFVKQEQFFT